MYNGREQKLAESDSGNQTEPREGAEDGRRNLCVLQTTKKLDGVDYFMNVQVGLHTRNLYVRTMDAKNVYLVHMYISCHDHSPKVARTCLNALCRR